MDVIPAKLHDEAGEVYDDKLYSLYTTSTNISDKEINVSVIASDLVKHTRKESKSYWVGIGINTEILDGAILYTGYGEPVDTEFDEPVVPDGEQEVNEQNYYTFYFDTEKATQNKNLAYVVVDREGIHYHYRIDFGQVSMKASANALDPIGWSGVSVEGVKNKYLFGIDLSDAQGNPLPEELFVHYINSATDYLQNTLDIVINETVFEKERYDYAREDWRNWGFWTLYHKPVKKVTGIRFMYGDRPSTEIPLEWVQLDKIRGQVNLFPAAGSANSLIIGNAGLLYGLRGLWDYCPLSVEIDYVAGIDENDPTMPVELLREAISKRASMGILNVWGDLIIGAGIANQSVNNIILVKIA